ncbi:MAG: hypothetical protein ACLQED_15760 [Desulfobaccales bacterium]
MIDHTTASLLEQRIVAYADRRAALDRDEGRLEAIGEALKKAELAVKRTRGERQKGVAEKVLLAVKTLLPDQAAVQYEIARAQKQGYGRGYRDGQQSSHSKAYRERNPRGIR